VNFYTRVTRLARCKKKLRPPLILAAEGWTYHCLCVLRVVVVDTEQKAQLTDLSQLQFLENQSMFDRRTFTTVL